MMTIMANSEVLDYPNGHVVTSSNQSKSNCQLLTVPAESILLLLFFNVNQNFLLIWDVPLL